MIFSATRPSDPSLTARGSSATRGMGCRAPLVPPEVTLSARTLAVLTLTTVAAVVGDGAGSRRYDWIIEGRCIRMQWQPSLAANHHQLDRQGNWHASGSISVPGRCSLSPRGRGSV